MIEASHYLAATGSAPWIPPVPGLDEAGFLTSTTAMELTELPESLVVIGGNAVGLQLGQLLARLGTRVTLVEALDRLAPFDEPEISAAIADVLRDEGANVITAATAEHLLHHLQLHPSGQRQAGRAVAEIINEYQPAA